MRTTSIFTIPIAALIVTACGTTGPGAGELNDRRRGGTGGVGMTGGSGGTDTLTGGSATAGGDSGTGGTTSTGGATAVGGTGAVNTGGTGATASGGGDTGATGGAGPAGGSGGSNLNPSGGSAGAEMPTGGAGGAGGTGEPSGGAGGAGGALPTGPYAPRTGPFKMLVYSKTSGYTHDSIPAGKTMLQQIASEQNFQATFTEGSDQFTAAGLGQYEIVFFMNPTGNNLTPVEKQAFETWMTTKNGAFAGVHSATDTENGWAFYSEVTGQYYDKHDDCCVQASVQWDAGALTFPGVRGLPNPWVRADEWYKFNRAGDWASKPGFKILSRVSTTGGGTRPVSFVREWQNFRSFYTSLGHQASTFQDTAVKKHITGGILWAVRREYLVP